MTSLTCRPFSYPAWGLVVTYRSFRVIPHVSFPTIHGELYLECIAYDSVRFPGYAELIHAFVTCQVLLVAMDLKSVIHSSSPESAESSEKTLSFDISEISSCEEAASPCLMVTDNEEILVCSSSTNQCITSIEQEVRNMCCQPQSFNAGFKIVFDNVDKTVKAMSGELNVSGDTKTT